jgi:hypothetical protein
MDFIEYMKQEKPVSRFFILRIGIIGALAGSILSVAFMLITATS